MSFLPHSERSTPRAIVLAGSVSDDELEAISDLICMHPGCFPLPISGENLIRGLPNLANYCDLLSPSNQDEGSPETSRQLRNTWDRMLRIELGNAMLRAASKIFSHASGQVMLVNARGLDGLEHYSKFFPVTPLVLLFGKGERSAEGLAAGLKAKGHLVMAIGTGELKKNPVQSLVRLLDFANLSMKEFPWKRLKEPEDQRGISADAQAGDARRTV